MNPFILLRSYPESSVMQGQAFCLNSEKDSISRHLFRFLWSRIAPAAARIPIPAFNCRGGVVVPEGTMGSVVIVTCVVGETERAGNHRSDRYQYLFNRSRLATIHRQGLKDCLVSGGFDPKGMRTGGSFKTLRSSANELTVNIYHRSRRGRGDVDRSLCR